MTDTTFTEADVLESLENLAADGWLTYELGPNGKVDITILPKGEALGIDLGILDS